MKLSIVLPCYNEEKNIPLILAKFEEIISNDSIELILVNNGSTDDSRILLDKLLPKYSFARSVDVDINLGYGNGITEGLKKSKGEFICYTHADLQTNPSDVLKALEIIENQDNPKNYFIKGNRKGRPISDQIFTIGMSIFETLYLGVNLWDINAQPNLFHKDFFKKLDNIPKDFSLDLYLLYTAYKKNLRVIRFDVEFPERIYGESKWNTGIISKWKFIKRTLSFSVKLKKEL